MTNNELLDEWAKVVYAKIDKLKELRELEPYDSYKSAWLRGHVDGLCDAICLLSRLERKQGKIKDLPEVSENVQT